MPSAVVLLMAVVSVAATSSPAASQQTPRERDRRADASLQEVGAAAQRGDWSAVARAYADAFFGSSASWPYRYNCWSGFTSVLREGNLEVTAEHMRLLHGVAHDAAAPSLHRVQAHFSIGFISHSRSELRTSREGYANAIRLVDAATADERQGTVELATAHGYHTTPVGSVLDELRGFASDNVALIDKDLGGGAPAESTLGTAPSAPRASHQHAPNGAQARARHRHTPATTNPPAAAAVDEAFDAPIVQTTSALEYRVTGFELAMRKRAAMLAADTAAASQHAAQQSAPGTPATAASGRTAGAPLTSSSSPSTGKAMTTTTTVGQVAVDASGGVGQVGSARVPLRSPMHTDAFEVALPLPQPSPRDCSVHGCTLLPSDLECQRNRSCALPLGHLAPMGEQFAAPLPVAEAIAPDARRALAAKPSAAAADGTATTDALTATDAAAAATLPVMTPHRFWSEHVAALAPLVLRGGGAAQEVLTWDDAFLRRHCALEGGLPWRVLVERNNRVVRNDRHPLMYDEANNLWSFCDFLDRYGAPEYRNMLYVVTPLTDAGVPLLRYLKLPDALRCGELAGAITGARLWMSGGNTTSSLHFDTHDNVMLQLGGVKEVYMWPPNQSALLYPDFHTKFGLSPISADFVDLERYPAFADSAPRRALLRPGDALYIPDGWWHLIRARVGRNVGVAVELRPFGEAGLERHWPRDVHARYAWPGLFWAEGVAIRYAMRERLGRTAYTAVAPGWEGRAITCAAASLAPPMLLHELLGQMRAAEAAAG